LDEDHQAAIAFLKRLAKYSGDCGSIAGEMLAIPA